MKLQYLLYLLISFSLFSCLGQNKKNISCIEPLIFEKKISTTSKVQIVDVRTPEEFENQHISKAININWNGDDFESEIVKLDKSKPVFVYCAVGGRSKKACEKMQELGFTIIYDLKGGIAKWNEVGL